MQNLIRMSNIAVPLESGLIETAQHEFAFHFMPNFEGQTLFAKYQAAIAGLTDKTLHLWASSKALTNFCNKHRGHQGKKLRERVKMDIQHARKHLKTSAGCTAGRVLGDELLVDFFWPPKTEDGPANLELKGDNLCVCTA